MPRLGGYRGRLQPAANRVIEYEARRPLFCLTLTVTVTLILATVFAVSAWNLRRNQFDVNKLEFHSGDEVVTADVCDDFSTLFCDEYEITLWQRATVFLFSSMPAVNTSDTVVHSVAMHKSPDEMLGTREYYLLEESSLEVLACRENGSSLSRADVCIIKGKYDYEAYHERFSPELCVVHSTIPEDAICSDIMSQSVYLNLSVVEKDTYYLVIEYGDRKSRRREHPRLPGILIQGNLTRTRYDVSKAERVCKTANKIDACSMPLDFDSDNNVIIRFGSDSDDETMTSLTTNCHVRLLFWIAVFGGSPFMASCLAGLFFAYLFCRKRPRSIKQAARVSRRIARRSARKLDKDELVHNEIVQGDQGGAMAIQDGDE